MKKTFACLLLSLSLTAFTCSKQTYRSMLKGRWNLYDQKGGFRIQPHPMPVLALEFSGERYKKYLDDRLLDSGTWTIPEEQLSGDTLRGKILLKNPTGEENHRIRAIGKDAFVLDEDAPAYDGIAYYYRKAK
ncbi:hypothetical protein [Hufsiella ginkgonis]|uniref:Lipocalin-like domain-containing protein n=1 Tax=Hufsiella ginkgonis TaxID=2695274 RepID=A0A7K1XU19_9SPHI|nr:hypothetical protein [Hufsiella ginkgonis]MXV14511.1 hypothetical protein [Hufsiella ginkgonis]